MSSTGLAHRYLQQIALDLIATPEENYLQEFVRAAGEAFEADMVLVSRVRDVECPVNAYAIYDASGQATEYSYPLRGTPCEQVFNENRPFVNLGELQACFPKDTDLQDFGLNAYVGMPLRDRHGECFGLIAALWRKPPSDPDAVLSVFQRVEPRLVAGVDLIERNTSERHALNAQLEILSKRLEVAVETAGLGVWDYDMETGELIWDRRMRAIYGLADDDSPMSYERWLAMLIGIGAVLVARMLSTQLLLAWQPLLSAMASLFQLRRADSMNSCPRLLCRSLMTSKCRTT